VVRENGKQRPKYIPNAQIDAAKRGRNEYQRLCEIVERITQINLLLMKVKNPPEGFEALEGAEIFHYGHLPAAAAFCWRLGLIDLINEMVPSEMNLKPGDVVQAMVLDTLSQRSPLYRVKAFLKNHDEELLLGHEVDAEVFSDVSIGRSLDAIFQSGPSKIVTELGARATRIFALDTSAPSYDTTSTNV